MKELVELTITFPESETQNMILEKNSEAYKQMIDYAEINEGTTSEKPHVNIIDHSKNHYLCDFRVAGVVEIHTKQSLEAEFADSNLYDINQGANKKDWNYKGEQITFSELMEKLESAPNTYSDERGGEIDHDYYMSDCAGMLIKRIWQRRN
jgi:hypothetical protein